MLIKLHVLLKPNSRHRQEVFENGDGTLTVYTKSPAIENRTNKEAIELLAKHFNVPKSRVKLIKGETSRQKVFAIDER